MFQLIKVDDSLADSVEKELSSVKPQWRFTNYTTKFHEETKNEKLKGDIDEIMKRYPVHDTQKFTDTIFNVSGILASRGRKNEFPENFVTIRQNPNSRYNRAFPNVAKLLDHLQRNYIPTGYVVKRILINLQTIRPVYQLNAIHPDFSRDDFITILYYVNNSDGDTYFFEGSECVHQVSPVKGTAAKYPSTMLHAGSTPVKTETRIVINFVFGPKR